METWSLFWQTRRPLEGLARPRVAAVMEGGRGYRSIGSRRGREPDVSVLQITLAGSGRFSDGRGEQAVPVGHAFLCRVGDPAVRYGTPPDATRPWRFAYFAFHGGREAVAALIARHGAVFPLATGHPALARILAWQRQAGERPIGAGDGAMIVAEMLGYLADPPRVEEDPQAALVAKAESLIAKRYADPRLAAPRLSRSLAVSREHLSRAFASQRGHGLRDAIARERIRRACPLLRDTATPVQDLARALGFRSPARFAVVFRRWTGVTPRAWRSGRGFLTP